MHVVIDPTGVRQSHEAPVVELASPLTSSGWPQSAPRRPTPSGEMPAAPVASVSSPSKRTSTSTAVPMAKRSRPSEAFSVDIAPRQPASRGVAERRRVVAPALDDGLASERLRRTSSAPEPEDKPVIAALPSNPPPPSRSRPPADDRVEPRTPISLASPSPPPVQPPAPANLLAWLRASLPGINDARIIGLESRLQHVDLGHPDDLTPLSVEERESILETADEGNRFTAYDRVLLKRLDAALGAGVA